MGVERTEATKKHRTLVHFIVTVGILQKNHIGSLGNYGSAFNQSNTC